MNHQDAQKGKITLEEQKDDLSKCSSIEANDKKYVPLDLIEDICMRKEDNDLVKNDPMVINNADVRNKIILTDKIPIKQLQRRLEIKIRIMVQWCYVLILNITMKKDKICEDLNRELRTNVMDKCRYTCFLE